MRVNEGGPLREAEPYRCSVNRTRPGAIGEWDGAKERHKKWTLSDSYARRGDSEKLQCFRVRAGVFASAHGRLNGVPGRIIGARAKRLH